MNYLAALVLFFIFTAAPEFAESAPPPVISANGFTCSANGGIVNCKGAFPGHASPVLTGVGFATVGMLAQYPDHVWSYQSDTGCLCKAVAQSMKCTSKGGVHKTFTGPDAVRNSSAWCRGSP